jgi:hypothetical protein
MVGFDKAMSRAAHHCRTLDAGKLDFSVVGFLTIISNPGLRYDDAQKAMTLRAVRDVVPFLRKHTTKLVVNATFLVNQNETGNSSVWWKSVQLNDVLKLYHAGHEYEPRDPAVRQLYLFLLATVPTVHFWFARNAAMQLVLHMESAPAAVALMLHDLSAQCPPESVENLAVFIGNAIATMPPENRAAHDYGSFISLVLRTSHQLALDKLLAILALARDDSPVIDTALQLVAEQQRQSHDYDQGNMELVVRLLARPYAARLLAQPAIVQTLCYAHGSLTAKNFDELAAFFKKLSPLDMAELHGTMLNFFNACAGRKSVKDIGFALVRFLTVVDPDFGTIASVKQEALCAAMVRDDCEAAWQAASGSEIVTMLLLIHRQNSVELSSRGSCLVARNVGRFNENVGVVAGLCRAMTFAPEATNHGPLAQALSRVCGSLAELPPGGLEGAYMLLALQHSSAFHKVSKLLRGITPCFEAACFIVEVGAPLGESVFLLPRCAQVIRAEAALPMCDAKAARFATVAPRMPSLARHVAAYLGNSEEAQRYSVVAGALALYLGSVLAADRSFPIGQVLLLVPIIAAEPTLHLLRATVLYPLVRRIAACDEDDFTEHDLNALNAAIVEPKGHRHPAGLLRMSRIKLPFRVLALLAHRKRHSLPPGDLSRIAVTLASHWHLIAAPHSCDPRRRRGAMAPVGDEIDDIIAKTLTYPQHAHAPTAAVFAAAMPYLTRWDGAAKRIMEMVTAESSARPTPIARDLNTMFPHHIATTSGAIAEGLAR